MSHFQFASAQSFGSKLHHRIFSEDVFVSCVVKLLLADHRGAVGPSWVRQVSMLSCLWLVLLWVYSLVVRWCMVTFGWNVLVKKWFEVYTWDEEWFLLWVVDCEDWRNHPFSNVDGEDEEMITGLIVVNDWVFLLWMSYQFILVAVYL